MCVPGELIFYRDFYWIFQHQRTPHFQSISAAAILLEALNHFIFFVAVTSRRRNRFQLMIRICLDSAQQFISPPIRHEKESLLCFELKCKHPRDIFPGWQGNFFSQDFSLFTKQINGEKHKKSGRGAWKFLKWSFMRKVFKKARREFMLLVKKNWVTEKSFGASLLGSVQKLKIFNFAYTTS